MEKIKKRFWAALAGLTLLLPIGTLELQAQEIPRMTPQELAARLGETDLIVLDVRAEADWKASDKKIQGAVREDPRSVGKWSSNYPKEKTIVLYCA